MPILPKYRTDFTNKGEKEIYNHALNSGYFEGNLKRYFFHSLRNHNIKRKLVGEVDFVYLDENSIIFLESKGGPVKYDSFSDKWLVLGGTKEGDPFKQVTDYLFYFRDKILSKFYPDENYRNNLIFGYGVMFPDVKEIYLKKNSKGSANFKYETIEYDPNIIYTSKDHLSPKGFVNYIEKLKIYWQSHEKYNHRTYYGIGLKGVDNIRKLFRKDLIYEIPLNKIVDSENNKILQYTQEQYDVLDSVDILVNRGFVITGGPGTGKTLLAKELILRKSKQGLKVAFFCFNKNLASETRKYFSSFEDLSIDVFHVHKYLYDYLERASLIPNGDHHSSDYWSITLPNQFKYWFKSLEVKQYDYIVIDEGQDIFNENLIDSIFCSLKGGIMSGNWSIFLDFKFQGFYDGFDRNYFELFMSQYPVSTSNLPLNCRNHEDIIQVASRHSGLDLIPCRRKDIPFKTKTKFYVDKEDLIASIEHTCNNLITEDIDYSNITVLTFDNKTLKEIQGGSSLKFHKVDEKNHREKGMISISTIHGYKGMENDFILIAGVEKYVPENLESMSLLYVGYTRAKLGLTVLFLESNKTKLAINAMK